MILSPVPPGLLTMVGPVELPHQLFSAFRAPVWPPAEASRPAIVFPTIQFMCAVMFEFGPMAKGSSTLIPRTPFRSTLLLTVMLLLPPKRRIVPFAAVEPMLVLPLIELFVTPPNTILSGVPATSSLLETARPLEGATTRNELLVSPLNLLLSIVALQRPKFVWMPLPEPGPALLLFWIRLNLTSVGLMQVESSSMPEMLF